MALSVETYALAKKYTQETAKQFGALKGAPCTIKSIVKQDGRNVITFEWENNEGETQRSTLYVDDGTPIYEWTAGDHYQYGDLAIYESAFYRCVVENSDTVFDSTKWSEIGSPDGNYDIVQNSSMLPPIFTPADKKIYFSIDDDFFWLWNGTAWVECQSDRLQFGDTMPTNPSDGQVFLYMGDTTYTYVEVQPQGGENPSEEGWYEYDESTHTYILTQDITINPNKTYYMKLEQYVKGVIYKYDGESPTPGWGEQTAGDTYIPMTAADIDAIFNS